MGKSEKFYPMTSEMLQKLRKAKLTAAEWRLWTYLIEIDPWGNEYQDIETLAVMTECNLSKPTFYRAKARIQELELFDFQEEKVKVRNLNGISKIKPESQKFNSSLIFETGSLKNETENLKNDIGSLKNETENLKNDTPTGSKPSQSKASGSSQNLRISRKKEEKTLSRSCTQKKHGCPSHGRERERIFKFI